MNNRKAKYTLFKINVLKKVCYFAYRIKSAFGIRTIGFKDLDTLVLMELLTRYKPDLFSVSVASVKDDLDTVDLDVIHDKGIRYDKADYLSIILNAKDRQVRIVKGENLNNYISDTVESKIVKTMQHKVSNGEIFLGLHLGIKQLQKSLVAPN